MIPLDVRPLSSEMAESLPRMFGSCDAGYHRYFSPFPIDAESLRVRLAAARLDRYWGIYVGEELAGMFMLRGFDEGYAVPSFGVSIAQAHAGRGLLKLSLAYAISWSNLNGINRILLKAHPDNTIARRTYEDYGFVFDRVDSSTGHHVYFRRRS